MKNGRLHIFCMTEALKYENFFGSKRSPNIFNNQIVGMILGIAKYRHYIKYFEKRKR